jgi:hypothetical protein
MLNEGCQTQKKSFCVISLFESLHKVNLSYDERNQNSSCLEIEYIEWKAARRIWAGGHDLYFSVCGL